MRRSPSSALRDRYRTSVLAEMLAQGTNRVSFGVQSFVDQEAAAVGRLHTAEIVQA